MNTPARRTRPLTGLSLNLSGRRSTQVIEVPMPSAMQPGVFYPRVRTKEQDAEGYSILAQLKATRVFGEAHDHTGRRGDTGG